MSEINTLRLGAMMSRPKGSFTRRVVQAVISIALRLFFHRIQTSDARWAPPDGPVIFVLNHPNGLIDPGLVFCALPRRVSFLAKSTLFRLPIIGWLLGVVEALPLYRRIDQGEETDRNLATFAACHDLLQRGRCIALFPEGVSHSGVSLLPLKSGAARIALGALAIDDDRNREQLTQLKIVPVGIYYTAHTPFRGEALLQFGPPLLVERVAPDANGQPPAAAVRQLTARIEAALRGVTLNFADAAERQTVRRAERVLASAQQTLRAGRSVVEEFQTSRWLLETATAARLGQLTARLRGFERQLGLLGLTPGNLVLADESWRSALLPLLGRATLLLLLLPLALVGVALHLPAWLISELLARIFRRHGPDEAGATVKVLAAIGLMPLTWLITTGMIFWTYGWRWALVALPLIVMAGYAGLRWVEEVYDLTGWLRALILLRRRFFQRLLAEGRSLREALGFPKVK
jgi:glycerol-3-phosphate O-acyltransferase / dihydroxyacetone phosphate acyltransferase